MTVDRNFLKAFAIDERTLGCPLCEHRVDVPDVPISDALGGVFGMSGDTFARVQGDQVLARAQRDLEEHFAEHPPTEWATAVLDLKAPAHCSICKRGRRVTDKDYDPVDVMVGQPLGWYSGDDGEICPEDMEAMVRKQ